MAITGVIFVVRIDCCQYLFSDIDITVGNQEAIKGELSSNQHCGSVTTAPTFGDIVYVPCIPITLGKYVVVQKTTGQEGGLGINEMLVYGCKGKQFVLKPSKSLNFNFRFG